MRRSSAMSAPRTRTLERARNQRRVPIEFRQTQSAQSAPQFFRRRTRRARGLDQGARHHPAGGGARRRRCANDSYEIIAGERRWRAAQRAGLHDIPIVPIEVTDSEALELAIIENVQRSRSQSAGRGRRLSGAGGRVPPQPRRHRQDRRQEPQPCHQHAAAVEAAGNGEGLSSAPGKIIRRAARMLVGSRRSGRDGARDRRARTQCAPGRSAGARSARKDQAKAGKRSARQRTPTRSRWSGACPMRSASPSRIDHRSKGGVLQIHYRSLDQLEDVLRRLES